MGSKRIAAILLAGFAGFAGFAGPAGAQQIVDSYCTSITENDKSASDGFQLTDAGSILRQDRANFHKFGYRDRGDESDRTFATTKARSRIPAMLAAGDTDRRTLRMIVRGSPHICVDIYRRSISVYEN